MADFFEYTCDRCGRPFCERISVMNLALDNIDDAFCLECLSEAEGLSPEAFYTWILAYVRDRECFLTPWTNFKHATCPRITDKTCFCTVEATG